MTPEEEALDAVVSILERLQIPHMITGSLATSHHGRPRATHDADIVVDPSADQLDALVRDLEATARFYVDASGAREALTQRRQFNVIETRYACKIDLIVRKDRPFSREELTRRQYVDMGFGRLIPMVSPEDAVLSKLEWARRGDSERQLRDAVGIVEINPGLDRRYIAQWAAQLGVSDLWKEIAGAAPES